MNILNPMKREPMKRMLFFMVIVCLLIAACATISDNALIIDAPDYIVCVSEVADVVLYREPYSPNTAEIEGFAPQKDGFGEGVADEAGEVPLTMLDRRNLIYEWLDITDEELRWIEDLTYDVRRPFEELTHEERIAQSGFRTILAIFDEYTQESRLARGFVEMCCGGEGTCSVYGSTPNPIFTRSWRDYWVFANWYAAFLYAGGYEAGFEAFWDDDSYDAIPQEMGWPG